MKTNTYARGLLKIRAIMVCLAIAGIAVMVFSASQSLAAQLGQITVTQTEIPPAPPLDLGAVFATIR